jgi:hypothetical protein
MRARLLVPRAAALACPLQHLEVPAVHRIPARTLVPREVILAQPLQYFELSPPRRQPAHAAKTSPELKCASLATRRTDWTSLRPRGRRA